MANSKSDVSAKQAYIEYLLKKGYEKATVTASPADITAEKDGNTYYFEIKKTSQKEVYFGAATLTEWFEAVENETNYMFVIAKEIAENEFEFIEYTPEQFLQYSYIPPFKVYFNIDFTNENKKKKRPLTREQVKLMKEFYERILSENN
jgi:Holliday junction resolvase